MSETHSRSEHGPPIPEAKETGAAVAESPLLTLARPYALRGLLTRDKRFSERLDAPLKSRAASALRKQETEALDAYVASEDSETLRQDLCAFLTDLSGNRRYRYSSAAGLSIEDADPAVAAAIEEKLLKPKEALAKPEGPAPEALEPEAPQTSAPEAAPKKIKVVKARLIAAPAEGEAAPVAAVVGAPKPRPEPARAPAGSASPSLKVSPRRPLPKTDRPGAGSTRDGGGPASPRAEPAPSGNPFLERSRIIWGLIIGALIFIGGSTPLAIRLWRSDNANLKLTAFVAVTLLLLGVGEWIQKKLKLDLTGRTLSGAFLFLAPLNLFAASELGVAAPIALGLGGVLICGLWRAFRAHAVPGWSAVLGVGALSLLQLAPGFLGGFEGRLDQALTFIATLSGLAVAGAGIASALRARGQETIDIAPPLLSGAALLFPHLLLLGRCLVLADGRPAFLAGAVFLTAWPLLVFAAFLRQRENASGGLSELTAGLFQFLGEVLVLASIGLAFRAPFVAAAIGLVGFGAAVWLYRKSGQGRALFLAALTGSAAYTALASGLSGSEIILPERGALLWVYVGLPWLTASAAALLTGERAEAHRPWLIGLSALETLGLSIALVSVALMSVGPVEAALLRWAAVFLVAMAVTYAALSVRLESAAAAYLAALCGAAAAPLGAHVLGLADDFSSYAAVFGGLSLLYALGHRALPRRLELLAQGLSPAAALLGLGAGLTALLGGPPPAALAATLSAAAAYLILDRVRRQPAWIAAATLLLIEAALAAIIYDGSLRELLRHRELTLVAAAAAAVLSVLVGALGRSEARREELSLPAAWTAFALAELVTLLEMARSGLSLVGAEVMALAALPVLVLALLRRSHGLSGLTALQLSAAAVLGALSQDWFERPESALFFLGLAFVISQAPQLLRLVGRSEDVDRIHAPTWRAISLLSVLCVDISLVVNAGSSLSVLAAGGLVVLSGLLLYQSKHALYGVLLVLHGLGFVTELILSWPIAPDLRLALIVAVEPTLIAALTLAVARFQAEEGWRGALSRGAGLAAAGLAPLGALSILALYLGRFENAPEALKLAMTWGSFVFGGLFAARVRDDSALAQLRAGAATLCWTLAALCALDPWLSPRLAAVALAFAMTATLTQVALLVLRSEENRAPFERMVIFALGMSIALTFPVFDSELAILALVVGAPAGLLGRRRALFGLGLAAASLAAVHGLYHLLDGRTTRFLLVAESALAFALAMGARFAGFFLPRGSDRWTMRWEALRAYRMVMAGLSWLTLVSAVGLVLSTTGRAELGAEFFLGLAVIAGLFGFWVSEAAERQSEPLVYLAELTLALGVVFVRTFRPALFRSGIFKALWPTFVAGSAFAFVFLARALDRERLRIFQRASERTGMALPAIAILGAFIFHGAGIHALTMIIAAGLYGTLSLQRGSRALGFVALWLACLGAVWTLVWGGVDAARLPYLFALPIGGALAVSGAMLRGRNAKSAALLRDIGGMVILGALSWSMFADQSYRVLESLFLLAASVGGLILGIRLRERTMMMLATVFLVLDLGANVFWLGQNQVWVWWVAIMVFGMGVILFFSYFERLRALVDDKGSPESEAVGAGRREEP